MRDEENRKKSKRKKNKKIKNRLKFENLFLFVTLNSFYLF